jgi:photosystem II stability/assembly factor-like uncharacterized protein
VLTTNDGGKNYKVEDPNSQCFPNWKKFKFENNLISYGPDGQVWNLWSSQQLDDMFN